MSVQGIEENVADIMNCILSELGEMHYQKAWKRLGQMCDDIENHLRVHSVNMCGFFQTCPYLNVAEDGYVSMDDETFLSVSNIEGEIGIFLETCFEDFAIKNVKSIHWKELVKSLKLLCTNVRNFSDHYSSSEKFWFFRNYNSDFDIKNDGYVSVIDNEDNDDDEEEGDMNNSGGDVSYCSPIVEVNHFENQPYLYQSISSAATLVPVRNYISPSKIEVENMAIMNLKKHLASDQPLHYEYLVKIVKTNCPETSVIFDKLSTSEKFWFFKSRPKDFFIEGSGYVSLPAVPKIGKNILHNETAVHGVTNNVTESLANLDNDVLGILKDRLAVSGTMHVSLPAVPKIKENILCNETAVHGVTKSVTELLAILDNDVLGILKDRLVVSGPMHYLELLKIARNSLKDNKDFNWLSDSEKFAFFKYVHSDKFSINDDGYVSLLENVVIESLVQELNCGQPKHHRQLVKVVSNEKLNVKGFFAKFSESDTYRFFRNHPECFFIFSSGYVFTKHAKNEVVEFLSKEMSKERVHYNDAMEILNNAPYFLSGSCSMISSHDKRLFFKSDTDHFLISDNEYVRFLSPEFKAFITSMLESTLELLKKGAKSIRELHKAAIIFHFFNGFRFSFEPIFEEELRSILLADMLKFTLIGDNVCLAQTHSGFVKSANMSPKFNSDVTDSFAESTKLVETLSLSSCETASISCCSTNSNLTCKLDGELEVQFSSIDSSQEYAQSNSQQANKSLPEKIKDPKIRDCNNAMEQSQCDVSEKGGSPCFENISRNPETTSASSESEMKPFPFAQLNDKASVVSGKHESSVAVAELETSPTSKEASSQDVMISSEVEKAMIALFQSFLNSCYSVHCRNLFQMMVLACETDSIIMKYSQDVFKSFQDQIEFFKRHSDLFEINNCDFVTLKSHPMQKSSNISLQSLDASLLKDKQPQLRSCMSEEHVCDCIHSNVLSEFHITSVRCLADILKLHRELSLKQVLAEISKLESNARNYFYSFSERDFIQFLEIHCLYFEISEDEKISFKNTDLKPCGILTNDLEILSVLHAIKTVLLSLCIHYLQRADQDAKLSLHNMEHKLESSPAYVVSFLAANYKDDKFPLLFNEYPEYFILEEEGFVKLREEANFRVLKESLNKVFFHKNISQLVCEYFYADTVDPSSFSPITGKAGGGVISTGTSTEEYKQLCDVCCYECKKPQTADKNIQTVSFAQDDIAVEYPAEKSLKIKKDLPLDDKFLNQEPRSCCAVPKSSLSCPNVNSDCKNSISSHICADMKIPSHHMFKSIIEAVNLAHAELKSAKEVLQSSPNISNLDDPCGDKFHQSMYDLGASEIFPPLFIYREQKCVQFYERLLRDCGKPISAIDLWAFLSASDYDVKCFLKNQYSAYDFINFFKKHSYHFYVDVNSHVSLRKMQNDV